MEEAYMPYIFIFQNKLIFCPPAWVKIVTSALRVGMNLVKKKTKRPEQNLGRQLRQFLLLLMDTVALVKSLWKRQMEHRKPQNPFPVITSRSQYLLLFSLFVTFHFQGKSDGPNLTGSTIGLFPPRYIVICGRGGALVFSLVSLRSSVTWAGHRPTDTNSLRELTALTGLRSARVEG